MNETLVLFKRLKRKPDHTLFEYTKAEFEKDRAWLQKTQSRKGNDSSH